MIKMDTIIILGAIALAYGGMLILYYRSYTKENQRRASAIMLNGIKSMRRGNLDKALIYFDRAYEYSIKTNNKEEIADALYNIGIIYKEKGEINNAIEYFNNALDIYNELRDNDGSEKAMLAIRSIR